MDQHKRPQARSIAFDIVWKARNFRIRYSCELIGLAEVNTFLLMHGKGTRQVRHKHCKKVLAKGLLENPCIMAELETERQQALRRRPLIAATDLGSAHRFVKLEDVMRTSGEDMEAGKVKQRRCVTCGKQASTVCRVWNNPSEGVVAYLCESNTDRECST